MADETRDRVLNAAGPIFARQGYDAATVREICAAADVNLASVNYHFGGKETLYLETVRLAHQQKTLRVPLPELPPDATRDERLHTFVRTMLQRLLGDDEWQTELLIREMTRPTHACKPLVEDFIRPQFERLLTIVDLFVAADTSETVRHQLAFSVAGQCLHYRVAGGFVSLLMKPTARTKLLDIDELADQITRFSKAALSHWAKPEATTSPSQRTNSTNRSTRRATASLR